MLDFGFCNMDCMDGMAQFLDKYFELAIVDLYAIKPFDISIYRFPFIPVGFVDVIRRVDAN